MAALTPKVKEQREAVRELTAAQDRAERLDRRAKKAKATADSAKARADELQKASDDANRELAEIKQRAAVVLGLAGQLNGQQPPGEEPG